MTAAADLIGFVRLESVKGKLVFFRPDGDGFYTQFVGRAKNANGNFRPVGNKNLGNRHKQAPGFGRRNRGQNKPRIHSLASVLLQCKLRDQTEPEGYRHHMVAVFGIQFVLDAVHIPIDRMR